MAGPGETSRSGEDSGTEVSFAALYSRYESRIYAFTYHMTGDVDSAAALTRETFLRAYRGMDEIAIGHGTGLDIDTWLHRLAADACLGASRRPRIPRASRAALDRLSPHHRLALLLREYAGLSCMEIGTVLGISGDATRALLFRAREAFRAARAPDGEGSRSGRQSRSAATRRNISLDEETSAP